MGNDYQFGFVLLDKLDNVVQTELSNVRLALLNLFPRRFNFSFLDQPGLLFSLGLGLVL